MKILLVTTHLNMGGIGIYVVSLAERLHKDGHAVFVASSGGDLVNRLAASGIRHVKIPIRTKLEIHPKVFLSALFLAALVRSEHIEVIHAQTRVTQAAGWYASRLTRRPLVTTCHGFYTPSIHRRAFNLWGERVIAISAPVKDHLMRDFNVAPERIALIYNGVDVDKFKVPVSTAEQEAMRNKLGLKKGMVAGMIGRLVPIKGHHHVLEVLPAVLKEIPGLQLLIVGDGHEKQHLAELACRKGLAGNVVFAGTVSDTRVALSLMDILVHPAVIEGLALAILEAFAAGVPVIASDVGGIPEIVKDFHNGLLIPPADTAQLTEKMILLLRDAPLRQRLKSAALESASRDFSLAVTARRIETVYQDVISHARA